MVSGQCSYSTCQDHLNSRYKVSSTNNAKIYNLENDDRPTELLIIWGYSMDLTSEIALDGILLHALLQDSAERGEPLQLIQSAPNQIGSPSARLRN